MAEVEIMKNGERLVFDRAISSDAAGLAHFSQEVGGRPLNEEYLASLLYGYPGFLVTCEGETVGLCYARGLTPDLIEVVELLVAPRFRGQGVGSKLLAMFEEKARPWKNVIFFHNASDQESNGFYQRQGYREVFATAGTKVLHKEL